MLNRKIYIIQENFAQNFMHQKKEKETNETTHWCMYNYQKKKKKVIIMVKGLLFILLHDFAITLSPNTPKGGPETSWASIWAFRAYHYLNPCPEKLTSDCAKRALQACNIA